MRAARLVLIGRESCIARAWVDELRGAGADVTLIADGASALRHLAMLEPDVILLDLDLDGPLDGFETCRAMRTRTGAPIAVAAASAGAYDEVIALAVGADHFIAGDTPVEVAIARVRALIRRVRGDVLSEVVEVAESSPERTSTGSASRSGTRPRTGARAVTSGHQQAQLTLMGGAGPEGLDERIVDDELEIDLIAREVRVGGVEVALTRIEFDLLVTLARHPRRVLTRDQLMAGAWDEPFDGSHVLDAHLSRLRGKIGRAGGQRVAHAVRGVGYRLRA